MAAYASCLLGCVEFGSTQCSFIEKLVEMRFGEWKLWWGGAGRESWAVGWKAAFTGA